MAPSARNRYLANAVLTASPAQLLTMLYDALASDVELAADALVAGDWERASERLLRAQAIVLELQGTLRLDVWDGADGLLAVYHYLYRRLVHANTHRDVGAAAECGRLVEPLRTAWHEAARVVAGQPSPVLAG